MHDKQGMFNMQLIGPTLAKRLCQGPPFESRQHKGSKLHQSEGASGPTKRKPHDNADHKPLHKGAWPQKAWAHMQSH